MDHDAAIALRLAAALGWWWFLRGRLPGQYPLLREAAGRAEPGSDGWCAAQFWLGWTALFSADLAASLGHFTALRDAVADRGPSRALADGLAGRSVALAEHGPDPPRRPTRPAAPWPWPGSSATRSGRCWPWASLSFAAS